MIAAVIVRISRREHQEPALAGAANESKAEPRLSLDLPAIGRKALDRVHHGAGEVYGRLQALGLDHLH